MIWKQIPNFSKYEVSEYGEVRYISSSRRNRKLKSSKTKHGYIRYTLTNDFCLECRVTAQHLVALAFIQKRPSSKYLLLHNDDDPANNHYSNLRWGTAKQNMADAFKNKRIKLGSQRKHTKLTEADIPLIRELYLEQNNTLKDIASKFQVHYTTVHYIINGRMWKHVA